MSWSSKAILSLAELIVYVLLFPIAIYTLKKHDRPALIAHIYLYIFILLRITADGFAIAKQNQASTAGAIVNSIGLSPLLLATAGFVGEARSYLPGIRQHKEQKKVGIVIELALHIIVIAGVALLASGNSNAAKATTQSEVNEGRTLAYAGAILLLVSWIAICVWALVTFRATQAAAQRGRGRGFQLPRLLIIGILATLPFLGVRAVYSVMYAFDHSPDLSPATATFLVSFFLIFLSQLICALVLVGVLFATRNLVREASEAQYEVARTGSPQEGVEMGHKASSRV